MLARSLRDDLPVGAGCEELPPFVAGAELVPPLRVVPVVAVRTAGSGFSTIRIGDLSVASVATLVEAAGADGESTEIDIRELPAVDPAAPAAGAALAVGG